LTYILYIIIDITLICIASKIPEISWYFAMTVGTQGCTDTITHQDTIFYVTFCFHVHSYFQQFK